MELHILFFILAGLLIAVLVGFSLWSARREKSQIFSNSFSTRSVVAPPKSNETPLDIPTASTPKYDEYQAMSVPEESQQQIQQEVESSLQNIKISLPNEPQVAEKMATHTYGQRIATQQHIQSPVVEENIAPNLEHSLEPIEINIPQQETATQEVSLQAGQQSEVAEEDNPFITLYIYAPQNQPFYGDAVVHYLEEVGLRFGEHQIFHRHQHIDDSFSPIIFSAANLMNPGTFDMQNINNFTTAGLVLFMQLPTVGSDIANIKLLMHNAEHLAASLGGFLFDDTQQLFSEHSRQRYMQRVMH